MSAGRNGLSCFAVALGIAVINLQFLYTLYALQKLRAPHTLQTMVVWKWLPVKEIRHSRVIFPGVLGILTLHLRAMNMLYEAIKEKGSMPPPRSAATAPKCPVKGHRFRKNIC